MLGGMCEELRDDVTRGVRDDELFRETCMNMHEHTHPTRCQIMASFQMCSESFLLNWEEKTGCWQVRRLVSATGQTMLEMSDQAALPTHLCWVSELIIICEHMAPHKDCATRLSQSGLDRRPGPATECISSPSVNSDHRQSSGHFPVPGP